MTKEYIKILSYNALFRQLILVQHELQGAQVTLADDEFQIS